MKVRYIKIMFGGCKRLCDPSSRRTFNWKRYRFSGLSLHVCLPLGDLGLVLRIVCNLLKGQDFPPHRIYGFESCHADDEQSWLLALPLSHTSRSGDVCVLLGCYDNRAFSAFEVAADQVVGSWLK